jgi:hypothetical protein
MFLTKKNLDINYIMSKTDSEITQNVEIVEQPSATLALTAILDNLSENVRPILAPILASLPDMVIIGLARTTLPNVNINVNPLNVNDKINELNIKVAEKNEKVAAQIAKADITNITVGNLTTGLLNNTASMIGLSSKPIVAIAKVPVDKGAQKEAVKIVKEIQKDKSSEINKKRKPRVVRIDQFLMDSAIIESKSFFADHALNDHKTVDARIKNVLEYKNNNTNLIKQNIIENLDKKNIKNVENIVRTIIKDRNKLIRLRRHLNAKNIINRLLPLQKNKNISEINKLVNDLSKNDVIRMDIKNALEKNKLDSLQKLLETEVKRNEKHEKIKDHKRFAADLTKLIKDKKLVEALKMIDNIVNYVGPAEYTKQIRNYLGVNDRIGLEGLIYQLLVEKQQDQHNFIKNIGRNLGLKLNNKQILAIKENIMLGQLTGNADKIAKELGKTSRGKIILSEIEKEGGRIIADAEAKVKQLITGPITAAPKVVISTDLDNINSVNLRPLVKDVKDINKKKEDEQKKVIIHTAAQVGIKINDTTYEKIRVNLASANPTGLAKTLVSQLSNTTQGKKVIKQIKNRSQYIINKDKAIDSNNALNNFRLDLDKAKIDLQLRNTTQNKDRIKVLEERIKDIQKVKDAYIKGASVALYNVQIKILVNVAKDKIKEAKQNLDKVNDAIKASKNNSAVIVTLTTAKRVAEEQLDRANKALPEAKALAKNIVKNTISTAKNVVDTLKKNQEVVKVINKAVQIKNQIASTPVLVKAKEITKSVLTNIKKVELKPLVKDALKLNIAKIDLENRVIINTGKKVNVKVDPRNIEQLKIAIVANNPIGDAKKIADELRKNKTGTKLYNTIKERVQNAVKSSKAVDAKVHADILKEEAKAAAEAAKKAKAVADRIIAQSAVKLSTPVQKLADKLKSSVKSVASSVKSTVSKVTTPVKSAASSVKSTVSKVSSSIKSAASSVKSTVSKVSSSIKSAASSVKSKVSSVKSNEVSTFNSIFKNRRIADIVDRINFTISSSKNSVSFYTRNRNNQLKALENWQKDRKKIFTPNNVNKPDFPKIVANLENRKRQIDKELERSNRIVKSSEESKLAAENAMKYMKDIIDRVTKIRKQKHPNFSLMSDFHLAYNLIYNSNSQDKNVKYLKAIIDEWTPTKYKITSTPKSTVSTPKSTVSTPKSTVSTPKSTVSTPTPTPKITKPDERAALDALKKAEANRKMAEEAAKKAAEAKRAADLLAQNAQASRAQLETKNLVEVAQLRVKKAKDNVKLAKDKIAEITKLMKTADRKAQSPKIVAEITQRDSSRVNVDPLAKLRFDLRLSNRVQLEFAKGVADNDLRLAIAAVSKAELAVAQAQIEARKSQQNSAQSGNKVAQYLLSKPAIQAQINKVGETKAAAKQTIDALRSGDRKATVAAAKDLMNKKTELTNGAYKAVGAAIGVKVSDSDIQNLQRAKKAIDVIREPAKAAAAAKKATAAAAKAQANAVKAAAQAKTATAKNAAKAAATAAKQAKAATKAATAAAKATKNAAKAAAAASKMKNLMKGPAALIIAVIAIILEKVLKLDEDDFSKCKPGDFDLNSLPGWAKKIISLIPGLGELFTLIGNKLCIKNGCPEGKPENSGGLCYPYCRKDFKNDGAMICWKQYPDFERVGAGSTITSVTKRIKTNTGTIPTECRPDQEKNGALCYPRCQSGYKGVGPVCWQNCAPNMVDTGVACEPTTYGRGVGRIPDRTPCPAGYRTDPVTCFKNLKCRSWWDKSKKLWGGVRTQCEGPHATGRSAICRGDEEMQVGLCYKRCKPGYSGKGPVCWRDVSRYWKKSYGRGAGSSMNCAPGLRNIAGLCYRECPPGFTMQSLGLCSQICPPGSTDFGVGCTRESYNRGVGSTPFSIYMKPRKTDAERKAEEGFEDISDLIEYYNIETFANFEITNEYETAFETFDNNSQFLEEFYNIDNLVSTIEKFNNEVKLEYFDNDNTIVVKGLGDFGMSEAFDNIEQFNIDNGPLFEPFSYISKTQLDTACDNGFCGLPSAKAYSQYTSNFGFSAPISRQPRSKLFKDLTPKSSKPIRVKDRRFTRSESPAVSPRFGSFAPIQKLTPKSSSIKSVGSVGSIASSVRSLKSNISLSAARDLTPKTGTTPKVNPFVKQAVKTLALSFPFSSANQIRLAKNALRNIPKVKSALKDREIKPLAKVVMRQVKADPPQVVVRNRLPERFYEINSDME